MGPKQNKGASVIGRGVVGGVVAGPAGAVVGAASAVDKNMRNSNNGNNGNSSGGCYVATAVYGSYDCPQVWTLRRYRDDTLAETWYLESWHQRRCSHQNCYSSVYNKHCIVR